MFKKFLIILIIFMFAGIYFSSDCFAKDSKKPAKASAEKTSTTTTLKGGAVININSEQVEYFQEKDQFVATGNVKINVEGEDTVMQADKVTYDHADDLIIAEKNVKIIKDKQEINGDFARYDIARDTMLIDNPNTVLSLIRINAEKAKIYPKKKNPNKKDTDVTIGTATINDQNLSFFLSSSGSKLFYDKNGPTDPNEKKPQTGFKPNYKIHSKKILVQREKDVDIITLLHSIITVNRYTIAKVPTMTLTSNKESKQIETNLPEIGSMPDLGVYAGWGPVFNLPHGSTLKLVPIGTLDRGVGAGGMGRYTSATNRSELFYSSLKRKVLARGEQKIPGWPTAKIQYGYNTYVENGFFGRQRPNSIVELVDDREIGSAMNQLLNLRTSAAFLQTEHRWGTGRFQEQVNIQNIKPLFTLGPHVAFGSSAQGDVSAYGNGKALGVARIGPTVTTMVGPWFAWAAYYQGGIMGDTPFYFDKYYYGRSNFSFNTSYRISKYLSVGYLTSLNLSKDNYDQKMLAENQIYCWVGPDDLRFRIAYDTKRNTALFDFNLLLGSDRSSIQFDKLKVTEEN